MQFEYDPEADAIYLKLSDAKIAKSKRVDPGVVLDLDRQNHLVGVEVFSLSRRAGKSKMLRALTGRPVKARSAGAVASR